MRNLKLSIIAALTASLAAGQTPAPEPALARGARDADLA
jgi:hypothetical protein